MEIQLRKGDFHGEAAEALNFTAEILRTRMKAIKLELAKLEARRNIDEATRQTVEQLLHDVAYFKTEPGFSSSHISGDTTQDQSEMMVEMHKPHAGR